MSVAKVDDFFNKIGITLDLLEQSNPQKLLPDEVKNLVRSRCNQLLQRVGVVHTQEYVVNENQEQNVYSNEENNMYDEEAEDADDEYGLSNENVRILQRFPTRESYNSYVQGPNDPLQPVLNNVNKNRLWMKASPGKTKKRPRSNIRSFMERKPPSIPSRPTKKGSFWNRNPLGRRRSRRYE